MPVPAEHLLPAISKSWLFGDKTRLIFTIYLCFFALPSNHPIELSHCCTNQRKI